MMLCATAGHTSAVLLIASGTLTNLRASALDGAWVLDLGFEAGDRGLMSTLSSTLTEVQQARSS